MNAKPTKHVLAWPAAFAVWLSLSTVITQPFNSFAQGTAFTYQGRMNDGANPANGIYDLRFAIYDSTNNRVLSSPARSPTQTPP